MLFWALLFSQNDNDSHKKSKKGDITTFLFRLKAFSSHCHLSDANILILALEKLHINHYKHIDMEYTAGLTASLHLALRDSLGWP